MSHPPINEEAFQALLSVFQDSPIHLSLPLFLKYVLLVLLLGKRDVVLLNGRLSQPLLIRSTICAGRLLTLGPRVSRMLIFNLKNALTNSDPSRKGLQRSSVRALLATVILLYASTCVFAISLLQYAVVTSRGHTTSILAQIYSTEYVEKGFDDAELAVTTAKTAAVVINVSGDQLIFMISAF